MTDPTDRLAEIKGWLNGETQPDNYTWESAVFERMDWLIAEVERLRAELGNAADIMEGTSIWLVRGVQQLNRVGSGVRFNRPARAWPAKRG